MKRKQAKRRISVEISEELYRKLDKIFDYGERKKLVMILLNDFLAIYEKYGNTAKYAILLGKENIFNFKKKE